MERKLKAFTLIELLAVLTILGILLSIAVPSMNRWIKSATIKQDTLQLYSFIQKARLISYSSRINTKLYKKNNKEICLTCQSTDTYCKSLYPSDITCYKATNNINMNNTNIEISRVGYFGVKGSIFIEDKNNVARVNCLTIGLIRVRVGKKVGNKCSS